MYAQLPPPPSAKQKAEVAITRGHISHELQSLVTHIGRHQSDKDILHWDLVLLNTTISSLGTPTHFPYPLFSFPI